MSPAAPTPISPGLGWRDRWQRWWLQRQPAREDFELTQRNTYILPTRAGLMLALTLLVLLLASINYQLNLGYLLTFGLAGSAGVALHLTHANLCGLRLQLQPGTAVFAGQAAQIAVTLHNPARRARHAIELGWLDADGRMQDASWTELPAQEPMTLRLRCATTRRGLQPLPALQLQTSFPLGTFRAWAWWRPAATLLVYPAPENAPPPLPTGQQDGTNHAKRTGAGEDWEGLRPWRQGDPLHWVAWKKVARQGDSGQGWISREFAEPRGGPCWLDAARTGLADAEQRLSRLCAWVLAAEAQGLDYGLRLEQLEIAPDHGPAHQQRCLEALALC